MTLNHKTFRAALIRAAIVLWVAFEAGAGESPIRNASFESPSLSGEGKQATNAAAEWRLTGTAGVFLNNGSFGNQMAGAEGQQLLFLNGTREGGVEQDV